MDELMTAGAELHMAKRARYSRDQAQQLRGRSRSQLMDLARDLEAQEQRLREELREARRSYVRRVSDLARRTENTVRGSAEALPHRQGACMLAATETAARSGETMARAALHQPSASFSFPRLQPGSTTAAAATTVTTACSTLGGAGLIMGAPHAARRSSGDGPAVVMGPPASVPPSRRCSGGGVPSGPMLAPRRDTEQSQPQQPQAWRQSAPALPAAAAQAPLTRDGVLSSVMAMLRSKAAATAAAPTPDAAPPPSKGQPVFPPHPTELRMARALSAKRSPAMPPPSSSSSPSQGWLSHKPAPTPLTSSPPVPLSLLLPLPQQALPQQLPAARASARFAIDQQHQHPRPMAQPQLQLAPSPRRAPVLQLVGGF
ncbi:hypothetical protein HXX76_003641 [Chlamydomonas incerta]|uniref:Uncharacterized protein n=1 Tax=Chlamydomonas incerta TaxID=51695 RepID=A0A835W636_CHLIN|nr:hypothetical protein HXX76_003641 [Chlamydomonas incerta]|eukprot:KAG2440785.1 hypothetical protein HXX76_003641 [Chlamydomonas incerta]